MPSMIAVLVADLQRHTANEAKYAGMSAGQRSLREQGLRMQAEVAEYILSRPEPTTTKEIAAYFCVSDECIRKHTSELVAAKKIAKLPTYPVRWWWKAH